eukprot:COSAG04_NODE_17638_length_463_cov_1.285714_2_plen_41_part_01
MSSYAQYRATVANEEQRRAEAKALRRRAEELEQLASAEVRA